MNSNGDVTGEALMEHFFTNRPEMRRYFQYPMATDVPGLPRLFQEAHDLGLRVEHVSTVMAPNPDKYSLNAAPHVVINLAVVSCDEVRYPIVKQLVLGKHPRAVLP